MSGRILTIIAHDARLQYRYGIYAAYGFVVALYAAILHLGGPHLPAWAVAVLVFTDPTALGFFFLGALMLLEKGERVREALAATPLSARDYFLSKVATLTAVSVAACVVLLAFMHTAENPLLLLAAVALTAVQYVGLGVPAACRFRTVNGYLIGSAALLTPVIAPGFLALLDPMPLWLVIIPAVSQLRLMLVALGGAEAGAGEIMAMLAVSALAAAAASWYAVRVLRRELGK